MENYSDNSKKFKKELMNRIHKQNIGLDYNGEDFPEDTEMKQMELICLIQDYSDYVQECFEKNTKPKKFSEFKDISNVIWNANLYNMRIGDKLYYYHSFKGMIYSTITKIWTEEDGTVQCEIAEYDEEVGAGELYTNNIRWKT